ncbi:unnamed protein product [Prunus armeniaca]
MPTEDSHDTPHHTPHEEVELLRASVAKMSEKYEHLHSKNIELEHDDRTLKRNWEKAQAQGSQREAPVQPRLDKGKGPLYPKTTKPRLLHISPPKDRPHELVKVYKDCRDRILDRQTDAIPISVKLKDPRVEHLGPPPKPNHLPVGEGAGDSENWGQYYSEDYESYHIEALEEHEPYSAPGHSHLRPSAPERLPHADPAMRLLFEKVRRLENEQHCSH